MNILVGRELDGGVAAAPESSLGRLVTGPAGLLAWLESQLGLALPAASFTSRMIPYLGCLRECDHGDAFYHRSFGRDEFGVAATLLHWRDTLFEAGWRGDGFDADASMRLLQFGTVEDAAAEAVPPGRGQRVQRVLDALDGASLEVCVELVDPPGVFPAAWQRLFRALGARAAAYEPAPACTGDSDLARLQRALLADREPGRRLRLSGDGTVVVLRDGSPQLSAPWIARFAHRHLGRTGDVAVLAQQHGATLDDALADAGYPWLGFRNTSAWRPPFQLLPLALELLWRPLNPVIVLQFLTHPVGPLPRRLRQLLAQTVAERPGVGGQDWDRAVQAAVDLVSADAGHSDEAKRGLVERIRYWLECDGFDPGQGIGLGTLRERVDQVAGWLTSALQAGDDEDMASLYGAALDQAKELTRSLRGLERAGMQRLSRDGARRLVEAVRGSGAARPARDRQCAPGRPELLRAERPAAFLEPVARVLWWGCDEEPLPRRYPWSKSEQASIARAGAGLLPLNDDLEWLAASWLRPILNAREQLVLVLHDNAEGHHPVFDELVAVAEGWVEERVDRLMRDPGRMPGDSRLPETCAVARLEIPALRRWWRLAAGVTLPKREFESFSSLEKFLFAPHQWVLDYQARIRKGALAELEDGARLKGTLAHRLFEDFFNAHADVAGIDRGTIDGWAAARLRTLIEQQGAVLLTPGRQSELEYFVGMAVRALSVLVSHLQSAAVAAVDMESAFEGQFGGGGLRGAIDLVATRGDGRRAVVDIKWGGLPYRRRSLQDSSYLQLGVYARLASQAAAGQPALAYFIIRDARLLVLDDDYFPNATVVRPDNGESHLEFWQRVETTWRWRRAQIERGLIEVPVSGTEPDQDSSPGDTGLPMPDTFDAFDDYNVLTGWSEPS